MMPFCPGHSVSRKRKKKNWEEEDFYDSDDDTFLDRTGMVERKRKERMKKAGKIEERPDTYDSLVRPWIPCVCVAPPPSLEEGGGRPW